ncbi:hypothetical protein JMJ35_010650 [Cladonia borealis]|uniref:Uncharacterized protein n=1 Tax=Cladonia borealis TaxID=184061 RepID=A0AA39QPX1_9LECA|nr:hypothetical protein JMJ35_010650 [Cladonia borealis]
MEIQAAQVGATFDIAHDLVDASSQSLGSHQPAQPELDQSAAFKRFGKASVNCIFSRIDWGRFNDKLACMVCIDVSISWINKYVLDYAILELLVHNDKAKGAGGPVSSSSLPRISEAFGPKDPPLEGPRVPVQKDRTRNIQVQAPTPIGQVGTPALITNELWTEERLWRITVAPEPAPKDRLQRILRCRMQGNRKSQIHFPERFRLGLIVIHVGQPFTIRFALKGAVIGPRDLAVRTSDALTFGGSSSSKLEYTFAPEDTSAVLTSTKLAEVLNETNGHLLPQAQAETGGVSGGAAS